MKAKVSIIVPIYNVERYINRCIDSIINQTYKNIEIILVDDESPDNCGKICDNYAKKNEKIKTYHKKNGGLSDARNYGLKFATGKYIAYVDSDDWIEPNMIEILVNNLEKSQADIAMCGTKVVNEDSIFYNKWYDEDKILNKNEGLTALLENRIITSHAWNKIYKKEIIQKVPWPKGRLYEDIHIMHKIFKLCKKIAISKEYLYNYYQRDNSICNNKILLNEFEYVDAFLERYVDMKDDSIVYKKICYTQMGIAISNFFMRNSFSKDDKNKYKEKLKEYLKMLKKVQLFSNKYLSMKEILTVIFVLIFKTYSNRIYLFFKNNK